MTNSIHFDSLKVDKNIELLVDKSFLIVEKIHFLLKKNRISQKQLAEQLGKKESEISKWLTGTHNFTLKTITKLEAILNEDIVKITPVLYEEGLYNIPSDYRPDKAFLSDDNQISIDDYVESNDR